MSAFRLALVGATLALLAVAGAAAAQDVPSFRISQVFSNIDGSLQYVVLTETEGRNFQHQLSGLTLTMTQGTLRKTFTFPRDLPTTQTAHLSIVVAATGYHALPVVVGGTGFNDGFAYNCCYRPAYATLPLRFIAIEGAMLDFAGFDQFSYSALPTDGLNALYRDGSVGRGMLPGNGCLYAVGCLSAYKISLDYTFAIEYYNAALDHYFLSANASDLDALDSGRSPGWQRTGQRFYVAGTPNGYPGLDKPVCRFYIPPDRGNSHFLSADLQECAYVRAAYPDFVFESAAAFWTSLPDPVTGECPMDADFNGIAGPLPAVYRLWNGRADSNHRYTNNWAIRDDMVARGWVLEGVAMCMN